MVYSTLQSLLRRLTQAEQHGWCMGAQVKENGNLYRVLVGKPNEAV